MKTVFGSAAPCLVLAVGGGDAGDEDALHLVLAGAGEHLAPFLDGFGVAVAGRVVADGHDVSLEPGQRQPDALVIGVADDGQIAVFQPETGVAIPVDLQGSMPPKVRVSGIIPGSGGQVQWRLAGGDG